MKWIKTAIGAVIAISVVPIFVLTVININKSISKIEYEEITIDFEYFTEDNDFYYYDLGSIYNFDIMIDYLESGFTITNLYDNSNDINITITNNSIENNNIILLDNNSIMYEITKTIVMINKTYDSIYSVNAENLTSLDIIFTKPKPNIITTLLSLAPIIFVGGVLFYFYKPFKRRD